MKSQEPLRRDAAASTPSMWIDHVSSTIRKPRQEIRQYESHMLSTLRCRDEDNHKSRQIRKVTIHDVTIFAPIECKLDTCYGYAAKRTSISCPMNLTRPIRRTAA